ncbi:MAG: coenzyme F420-0:L-glutamate ligase [Candidatus Nanopelagicales bacterium]|jgi:coenzyme F420-0:L-glutamate ligase / coenzyme F420-1:gamma-L-glutamate ligase|nr:coenzyme F420-0:L-glutamate ligase [Candidatus Nanopelagicales bacterium]MDP4824700.1 coenzyme F420-0:L-glutamate ligase [Candidatus Nanopelagicales bacterium]MDP4888541.1 coenzyme F420-0:L-glutamate ligase [Candidatus Nanopelagicales bacterium]
MTTTPVIVVGVDGIGEITPGDDLAGLLGIALANLTWPDGSIGVQTDDVVVVTSKIVSKAEGRIKPVSERSAALDAETVEILAEKITDRGVTQIIRNRHGVVLAAAGIDESNAPSGQLLLLPVDPDASAARLREVWEARFGVRLGVIITDTLGRAWREGLTDSAIGVSGVAAISDLRGTPDTHGNTLEVTMIAIADEIAAAADLVKGKATHTPIAVVRGIQQASENSSATDLVRDKSGDLFTLGTAEAIQLGRQGAVSHRRTVRHFTDDPVPAQVIEQAVRAATMAPAPHHTTPWQFIWPQSGASRTKLLDAMAEQWKRDLIDLDSLSESAVQQRISRGNLLREAPEIVCAFVDLSPAHVYPDERRANAERDLFLASGAAGIQNFMIDVAARGLGSAWVSSSMFCADTVREALELTEPWLPVGIIAVGYPKEPSLPREQEAPLPLQRR